MQINFKPGTSKRKQKAILKKIIRKLRRTAKKYKKLDLTNVHWEYPWVLEELNNPYIPKHRGE